MKKIILIVSVLLLLALLVSCYSDEEGKQTMVEDSTGETVKMTAIVKNIEDKIEVEVIEGEYEVSGIFWVNVSSDTVYLNAEGIILNASNLKVGDVIEITYSGQVALSYPPQIFAKAIQIK